ncbi:protein translocase subunit SecF [Candidatus Babeliales bacterium]|nr:protein translocase subunit SecF [Candidatus Babeliales bacterium]
MIDFLKYRHICAIISAIILFVGLVAYFIKGGFKYHIDFSGGTQIRVSFDKKVNISDLRKAIAKEGWKDSIIQSIGISGREFLVRVGDQIEGVEKKFKSNIDRAITYSKMTVDNVDMVGAEVGKNIKWNAIIAILLSLILILLYVAIRYKYIFAVGAVAAIAHDVLVVLVCVLLFGEPISLHVLAAILAILGYSLNDTIVTFSRIRENLKKMRGDTLINITNTSINQTLKRTLLTSISTLAAVGSFFLLGGETLRGFSFVMLIGIIVGTYSSIYIASSVILAIGPVLAESESN